MEACLRMHQLDGWVHNIPENKIKDEERERELMGWGYTIIRFKNRHVLDNIDDVLKKITENLPDSKTNSSSEK